MKRDVCPVCLVGAATTLVALCATTELAWAEGSSGAEILIPKLTEFIPALIAFLIIWALLARFVWPQVLSMMDERQKKIQEDLEAAEALRKEAAEETEHLERKVVEAHREAEAIMARAKREAEEERSRILAKAQREASEIITKAHSVVASERHKAMVELSSSVVDLAVDIAGKIIGEHLSEDQQRRLAEQYLEEVGHPDER